MPSSASFSCLLYSRLCKVSLNVCVTELELEKEKE